ncbi:hypothetical protein BKA57DRAFT_466320 [Linnemannia elongata]|nr:hypothetical protein BKA57DRAFT_466320 [Linnemannia elongata]
MVPFHSLAPLKVLLLPATGADPHVQCSSSSRGLPSSPPSTNHPLALSITSSSLFNLNLSVTPSSIPSRCLLSISNSRLCSGRSLLARRARRPLESLPIFLLALLPRTLCLTRPRTRDFLRDSSLRVVTSVRTSQRSTSPSPSLRLRTPHQGSLNSTRLSNKRLRDSPQLLNQDRP